MLAVAGLARLASRPGQAEFLRAKPVTTCAALSEHTVQEYRIVSNTDLEAASDVPERCRLLGVLPPEIVFGVVLPSEWNGRIVMRGNDGYAGNSPDAPGSVCASERIVADGFESVYTYTGHDRAAEPLGTVAFNNRQNKIDHNFRAVRLTIQTAKELVGIYSG